MKTDDKTKLSNRRRRFAVTIIDSALIFYKVAALQCTAFDWQFNELEKQEIWKSIINAIAVLNKTTVQELKGYFFVCTQGDAELVFAVFVHAWMFYSDCSCFRTNSPNYKKQPLQL